MRARQHLQRTGLLAPGAALAAVIALALFAGDGPADHCGAAPFPHVNGLRQRWRAMTGQPPPPAASRPGSQAGSEALALRPDNSAFVLQIVDNLLNNTVHASGFRIGDPSPGHQAACHCHATRPHHV